jgi:hypothetical protein
MRWSASRVRPWSPKIRTTAHTLRLARAGSRPAPPGSGDGAHQFQSMLVRLLVVHAQVDHMTAPGAGDVASHSPPQLAPAAYLSLNSPLAASFLYHLCTALLHYCITRSLSYDGHPCFRAPAGAPSARDGHANSHLARSICHVSFLRLFRRRIYRNSRPRSLSSSLASSLPDPPGGPPC